MRRRTKWPDMWLWFSNCQKTDKKSKWFGHFFFQTFRLYLQMDQDGKRARGSKPVRRWRIVSPATAGEKKCLLLPDAAQMLRCTRTSRGWFNWSQIVKICKNENFGFGIGPCVKPSSRNCTTEWLAPIVQPFREQRYNNKNLFQHNDTTTRTFLSPIQHQKPFQAQ